MKITMGTRGPNDDFYCHKFEVWYRVDDCVFRGTHKTFAGCVDCFQGRLNMRSLEKGIRPPAFLSPDPPVGADAHAVASARGTHRTGTDPASGDSAGGLIQRFTR